MWVGRGLPTVHRLDRRPAEAGFVAGSRFVRREDRGSSGVWTEVVERGTLGSRADLRCHGWQYSMFDGKPCVQSVAHHKQDALGALPGSTRLLTSEEGGGLLLLRVGRGGEGRRYEAWSGVRRTHLARVSADREHCPSLAIGPLSAECSVEPWCQALDGGLVAYQMVAPSGDHWGRVSKSGSAVTRIRSVPSAATV